jgi:hypothetical protein
MTKGAQRPLFGLTGESVYEGKNFGTTTIVKTPPTWGRKALPVFGTQFINVRKTFFTEVFDPNCR